MSTIKTTTLSNVAGTSSVPVDTVINGSAKAWVNFNGTGTVAIRAAFNVSSITDRGTGEYTINFTVALSDANYAFSGAAGSSTTINGAFVEGPVRTAQTTSAIQIAVVNHTGTLIDVDYVSSSIFR